MTPAPKISPLTLPTKFTDEALAAIEQEFLAARDQHVQSQSWQAQAAAQVAKAGSEFSEAVRGTYATIDEAISATSKAEKALASAHLDKGLIGNIENFRRSVAETLAAQARDKERALAAGAVQAATQTWREERDQVAAWFSAQVVEGFIATPAPLRAMGPAVSPEVLIAYDQALRDLDAVRVQLNQRGQGLNELQALDPRGVIATAQTEAKFVQAAA